MAILRTREIRKLAGRELDEKLLELKKELMRLRSQVASGTLPESPGKIKEIKRTLARIKTIQKEKGGQIKKA